MISKTYKVWCLIQENIGDAKMWPAKIRRLFWTSDPRHWDRILLCTFVVVNGLDLEIFKDWICLRDWIKRKVDHAMDLCKNYLITKDYKLYGFNVGLGRYVHLNMSTHYYNRHCPGCDRAKYK